MSRRKLQWIRRVRQAGNVDKVIPSPAKGEGLYLTKMVEDIPGFNRPGVGMGEGNTVTEPMSSRKEELVRRWTK